MSRVTRYLCLPPEPTAFELRYLARVNHVALWFFVGHLPLFVAVAAANGTDPLAAALLTVGALAGPALAARGGSPRRVSVVMGVTAMFMGGILVHIGQGPVQIEMHFYFFVLIALLAVFANPLVIVAAAATVSAHHAVLWAVLPRSVFNYDAPLWVVGVHAAFVVLESVAACALARTFFDNVVGLEKIVAARTAEVEARNRDMRRLLGAVEQGFLTLDRHGTLSEERSAAVDQLLGAPAPGATLSDVLRPHDPQVADWMALGLEDVFADVLPVEVTLDQLPKRLESGARVIKLEYSSIPRGGPAELVAVVLTDITARERAERENRVLLALVDHMLRDRTGFLEFAHEVEELIQSLAADTREDLRVVRRKIHTLKGNASVFGLEPMVSACHKLEDEIAETNAIPAAAAWAPLRAKWDIIRSVLRRLAGDSFTGITLSESEYRAALVAALAGAPRESLVRRLAMWRLEPTATPLARLGEHARQLAARSEKGDIDVRACDHGLRAEADHWALFWSTLVHVVRNAVGHGLETPAERIAAGKSPTAVLEISTALVGSRFVVAIRDDGRGIDWPRVAAAAVGRGLPAATPDDLTDALFQDGLSTDATVSHLSGRGIGLAAVRAVCRDMDGRIAVRSAVGQGTAFEFSFPTAAMAPSTFGLLRSHGVHNPEEAFFGDNIASGLARPLLPPQPTAATRE